MAGIHRLGVAAKADVAAVLVRHDVGEEEGVVERGVEGVLLGRCAPGGVDAVQHGVPACGGLIGHVAEGPAGILGRQVVDRILGADERQGDLHGDRAPSGVGGVGVEAHVGAAAGAGAGTRVGIDACTRPGAVAGEGLLERSDEVDRVVVARPAELPARDLTLHLVVAHHVDLVGRDGVHAPADLEQEVGLGALGEGDLGDAGPSRHGEAYVDGARTGGELHLVAAGRRLLVLMREGLTGRFGSVAYGTDGGKDGHVLVRLAPGPAEVGQAEALDARVADVVAPAGLDGVRGRVGAPLDHAEGEVGTGELAHGARGHGARTGPIERVDEGGGVADRRGRLVGGRGEAGGLGAGAGGGCRPAEGAGHEKHRCGGGPPGPVDARSFWAGRSHDSAEPIRLVGTRLAPHGSGLQELGPGAQCSGPAPLRTLCTTAPAMTEPPATRMLGETVAGHQSLGRLVPTRGRRRRRARGENVACRCRGRRAMTAAVRVTRGSGAEWGQSGTERARSPTDHGAAA